MAGPLEQEAPVRARPNETDNGRRRQPPDTSRRRRSRGGSWLTALLVLLLAAIVALLAWLIFEPSSSNGADAVVEPVSTSLVPLERRDLIERETLEGTLGYEVNGVVVEDRPGTLTALIDEGAVPARGDVLWKVDERAVVLMKGSIPSYRLLERGVDPGEDVFQLELNLIELGHDPDREILPDNRFTHTTENAVKRWQRELGMDDTGVVERGDVVFSPDDRRVGTRLVDIGARVAGPTPVFEVTAPAQAVTLNLDTDKQDLLQFGDAVTIELPGGETISGVVREIGTEATEQRLPDGSSAGTTLPVTIDPLEPVPPGLTDAPVDVVIERQARTNALVAPVTALVALQGGGYAIEVSEGGTTSLRAVQPGLYSDGLVEITGAGLDEGMQVVVPG